MFLAFLFDLILFSFVRELRVVVQNVSHTVDLKNEMKGSRHKTGEVNLIFSGMEVDPLILTSHSSPNGKHDQLKIL